MSEKIKKLLNNKYFIVALVALLIVLVIGTGTYAWLTWSSPNTTKLTVKIGNIADVIFDNGKEINTTSLAPVFTYDQGEKTSFSIVKRSTATSANIDYTITLNITSIAAELKVASFKYVLLNGNQVVRQGDFSSASSGGAISLSSSRLTDTRADFTFYIYIDGNTENNANMMNKEFKATINVSASEGSNTINAVQHITNLYLNNKDYTMQNGDVVYSIASSENLMMDKNGGITEEEDSGNLRYYGEYPKNYIFFNCDAYPDTNCEIWRIIGVFNGKLKIIRDEPISTTAVPMDLAGATYWKNTTIGKIFNYNEQSCSLYWSNSFTESCSVAESVLSLDSNFIYDIGTENTLKNNETKSMIAFFPKYLYSMSNFITSSNALEKFYQLATTTDDDSTDGYIHVGIMDIADYGYTSDFAATCGGIRTMDDIASCGRQAWLYKSNTDPELFMNSDNGSALLLNSDGGISLGSTGDSGLFRPVVYLNANVKFNDLSYGDGQDGLPYQIVIE